MASNLCRSGARLTVYNRSSGPAETLAALGAAVVTDPAELFAASDIVILMLADDVAVDTVLDRHGPDFARRVSGRLVVNMGTHAPRWSYDLSCDVIDAGGRFVEAPVSGSRGPAESGDLVAMLAGEAEAVARTRPILAPMCREWVETGAIPSAMALKMAVNLYLIGSVTVLSEAAHFAALSGLDPAHLATVIDRGPLGSTVTRTKLAKMIGRDFSPQASIRDVVKNARLVAASAEAVGADAPLLAESRRRFEALSARGDDALDMAAVLTSYEQAAKAQP